MPGASLYPDLGSLAAALRTVAPGTVGALGARWQRELDDTVARWQAEVGPAREAALLAQVEAAVHAGHPASLAALQLLPDGGAPVLVEAMRRMAAAGAESVIAEAAAAGVELDAPAPVAVVTLADWAQAAANLLAAGLALGIGREALRRWRPGATAPGIADGVREYLGGLSDRPLRDVIGGALTRAQNLGRMRAYAQPLPPAVTLQLVADETLDSNTCAPCRRIDGVVLPTIEAAMLAYGGAGYLFCQGGERCRGTVRGVWQREEQHDALFGSLPAILARHYKRDSHGRFADEEGAKALREAAQEARELAADSPQWHRLTGGASGSGVRLATLPGGRRVVHKRAPDWGSDEPRTQADAEELASLTARALGANVALTHRDDTESIWIEHIAGPTLDAAIDDEGDAPPPSFDRWLAGNGGKRMGLADVLIGNNDRNAGNMIMADGGVTGIDHAYAFEMIGYHHGTPHPDDLGRMGGEYAPARHYAARGDDTRPAAWLDNPMTSADVAETRRRLIELRPAFNKRGRGKWLDNALTLLDQLEPHATGTRSIYED